MHIPDGFLDARTCVGTFCLAGAGLGWAGRRAAADATGRSVPLMGVMSAFVFAGQMINFPVASGTSGHLLGAALATTFLGPWAASLTMATVVTVQCLVFQDGGVTVLGANLLNMALVATWVAHAVQTVVRRVAPGARVAGAAVAAWVSVLATALLCSLELASSGTIRFGVVAPAMALAHVVIGLGEAVITASVVSFVLRLRPDLEAAAQRPTEEGPPLGTSFGWAALATVGLVLLLAPWASALPDGLEAVAEHLGFADRERASLSAPAADYTVPGVPNEGVSTILAGVLGAALCVALWLGIARWWRPKSEPLSPPANGR